MGINSVWALGFLIFIPGIIILYLLKQKAKEQEVSSLSLWREVYRNMSANTWWEKLKHNILLYLQLIIMCLCILALASPYIKKMTGAESNYILVLDTSASMTAEYEKGISRLDYAKKQALEFIEQNSNANIAIVSCNNQAQIEQISTQNVIELRTSIEDIEQTEIGGTLANAQELLSSMVEGNDKYEVILFTDSNCEIEGIQAKLVDVSSQGTNLSMDFVTHTKVENQVKIMAKVSNQGVTEQSSDVNLYINDKMYDIKTVELKPGESKVIYFEEYEIEQSGEEAIQLKAEINNKDSLMADNIGFDIVQDRGKKKVLLVTEQNVFLEKALISCADIELFKTREVNAVEEGYDLYIFDGKMPLEWPQKGNVLLINPSKTITWNEWKEGNTEETEGKEYDSSRDLLFIEGEKKNIYLKTCENSVTQYISEYSFGVNKANLMTKPEWADSFLQYGESSAGIIGQVNGRAVAAVGFDLHGSELPLQMEFPILMNGLISACLQQGVIEEQSIEVGDSIELKLWEEFKNIKVANGEKSYKLEHNTEVVIFSQTVTKGIYEFTFERGGKSTEVITEYLSVNYPAQTESNMSIDQIKLITNKEENQSNLVEYSHYTLNLERYVIVAVLLLLCVEWYFALKVR